MRNWKLVLSAWHLDLWTTARDLHKDRMLRASLFWLFAMPPLAYLLDRLPPSISFNIGTTNVDIPMGLPFNWKLLYVGSIFYSLAGLIFSFRAPIIIKSYQAFSDFAASGRTGGAIMVYFGDALRSWPGLRVDPRVIEDMRQFVDQYVTASKTNAFKQTLDRIDANKSFDKLRKHHECFNEFHKFTNAVSYTSPIRQEMLAEAFWFVRKSAQRSNYMSLHICLVCFYIAYCIYGIVAFQGFYFVCKVMMR
jgi:hypothetical protein